MKPTAIDGASEWWVSLSLNPPYKIKHYEQNTCGNLA